MIEMQAGRELDGRIGTALFGYHLYHYDKDVKANCYWMLMDGEDEPVCQDVIWRRGERGSEEGAREDCPRFSTDIAAAWQIIEHFQDAGWLVQLRCEPNRDNYAADFFRFRDDPPDDETGNVFAPTMPLAVCRAALAAVGEGGAR